MMRLAYLRVYVPLTEIGGLDPHVPSHPAELRQGRFGLVGEPLTEDGLMTDWMGERFMCPRTVHLRMLQGVLAFHNAYREIGAGIIIPEQAARRAAEELERLHHRRPGMRSHILTSAWHVPPRWFLAFAPDEKELADDGDRIRVRYRTRRLSASGRLRRALDALVGAGFTSAVTGDIEELSEWLDEFPEEAMVELDYGSVAEMFASQDLVTDDSVEEIWASVEALESGDLTGARDLYIGMAGKWSAAMAVGFNS